MGKRIKFFVPGKPRPAGSKRAIHHRVTGKIIVLDMSGKPGKAWRKAVAVAAKAAMCGPPLDVPLRLHLIFVFSRPKSHYGTGRNRANLKASAPRLPGVQPDATKLLRSVEDAMTGIVYEDDALIVYQLVEKCYAGDRHNLCDVGVQVTVEEF